MCLHKEKEARNTKKKKKKTTKRIWSTRIAFLCVWHSELVLSCCNERFVCNFFSSPVSFSHLRHCHWSISFHRSVTFTAETIQTICNGWFLWARGPASAHALQLKMHFTIFKTSIRWNMYVVVPLNLGLCLGRFRKVTKIAHRAATHTHKHLLAAKFPYRMKLCIQKCHERNKFSSRIANVSVSKTWTTQIHTNLVSLSVSFIFCLLPISLGRASALTVCLKSVNAALQCVYAEHCGVT